MTYRICCKLDYTHAPFSWKKWSEWKVQIVKLTFIDVKVNICALILNMFLILSIFEMLIHLFIKNSFMGIIPISKNLGYVLKGFIVLFFIFIEYFHNWDICYWYWCLGNFSWEKHSSLGVLCRSGGFCLAYCILNSWIGELQ